MTTNFRNAIVYYVLIGLLLIIGIFTVTGFLSIIIYGSYYLMSHGGFWSLFWFIFGVIMVFMFFKLLWLIPLLPVISYHRFFKCKSCNMYDANSINLQILKDGIKLKCTNCGTEQ